MTKGGYRKPQPLLNVEELKVNALLLQNPDAQEEPKHWLKPLNAWLKLKRNRYGKESCLVKKRTMIKSVINLDIFEWKIVSL